MRQIIILNQVGTSDQNYNYLFRLSVPESQQSFYANQNATSFYNGATADEIAAIQAGQITEVTGNINNPMGTQTAEIKAKLQKQFQGLQDDLNIKNKYSLYGTSFDGKQWS